VTSFLKNLKINLTVSGLVKYPHDELRELGTLSWIHLCACRSRRPSLPCPPGVLGVAQVGTEAIRAGDEVVSNGSHVRFTSHGQILIFDVVACSM